MNITQPEWHNEPEGKLTVDVAQTEKDVFVVCTMAGADPKKVTISVHGGVVTIRGERVSPLFKRPHATGVYSECFWGKFSRSVVLPVEVKDEGAKATYKNGVLTIQIPRKPEKKTIPIIVVDE